MIEGDSELHGQAAEWIGVLRRPQLTDENRADFATWLATSAEHRAAFDDVMQTWDQLDVLRHVPVQVPATARTPRSPEWQTVRWPLRVWRGRWLQADWWQAASLAGVVSVALTTAVWLHRPAAEVRTLAGQTKAVQLVDGSRVEANVATTLNYRIDSGERLVDLVDGEAFFLVAHDPTRPFRVHTRDGLVTATGTAFSIQQRNDGTRLALTQGTVTVAPALRALPAIRVQAPALLLITVAAAYRLAGSADDAVAWRQGQLIYDQVTLAELLADLNRYMPAHVQLTDPTLAQRRVSAVLRIEQQEATLNALSRILHLRWRRVTPDLIQLGPNA